MDLREEILQQAKKAMVGARELGIISTEVKNQALVAMATALESSAEEIIEANKKDLEAAKTKGMKESMQDRLLLTEKRISDMAEGLRQVAELKDPVGDILSKNKLTNGLEVTKISVPMGVVGIIYEARPNVTADAIGLCVKSGNAVVLKGGSEALLSNKAIAEVLTKAAEANGIPKGSIQLIESTDRQAVKELITLNGIVDVVIPRGGAGLIQMVVQTATVPVIETGIGVCHVYVDAGADCKMAANIIINAKVQRPSVCNALETLLVNKDMADEFFAVMLKELKDNKVEIFADEKTRGYDNTLAVATEEDWQAEYGDLRLAVKVVDSLEEALEHIAKYGTKHSECIITNDHEHAARFQLCVDAAAVYVNASTRFTDGFEFGFGAEIGISTQKLHARGPMALPELTTYKYLITGNGQTRK